MERKTTKIAPEEIAAQLDPNFEKLGKLITDFTAIATSDQKEALSRVVGEFTQEMNRSLDGAFSKLSAEVDEQYRLQQKNSEVMNEYYRGVIAVQAEMKQGMESLSLQTENNQLLKREWAQNMQAVVDSCSGTSELVEELKDEVGRLARSRRKQV